MNFGSNTEQHCLRHKLLMTISAVALTAMISPGMVRADDRPSWATFELNYDRLTGDSQIWSQNIAPVQNLSVRPDDGISGTIGFVTPLHDSKFDVGIFARFGMTENERAQTAPPSSVNNVLGGATYTSYALGQVKHSEHHVIVDFEARRDLGFGSDSNGIQVTAKGGLRFGYFEANTDTAFSTPGSYQASENRKNRLLGLGPRIGIDAVAPLSDLVQVDLSAAGSLLLGDQHIRVTSQQPLGAPIVGNTTDELHTFRVIPMLEASAAVGFNPTGPGGALISLGVRGEAWFGAFDQRTLFNPSAGVGTLGTSTANRYSLGPFIRIKVPFGGG